MKTNNYNKKNGFSLLELMFVVLIIGIISSIAIPIYQDFISKTQISSAYQELATLKVPIDLMQYQNDLTSNVADVGWVAGNSTLIITPPTITLDASTNKYALEGTIDGNAYPVSEGVKIKLQQTLQGGWACILTKSNSPAWKNSFSPKECQVVDS